MTCSEKINKTIHDLVYKKTQLQKAYNYYHGHRDAEQFRHLEHMYGIGTPTSVTFTPLVKKHIDVLIGEYLGLDQALKISCKDSTTVSNILRDKHLKINHELHNHLKQYLHNNIIQVLLQGKESIPDPYITKQLELIKSNIESTFVSDYEIAAQNILEYIKQSRNIDLKNKMKSLFLHLLITGTAYYRVKPTESGSNVSIEILNPLNTFVERNPNSEYLSHSRRAVIRKYMSREEILNEYRNELKQSDVKQLKEHSVKSSNDSRSMYVRIPIESEVTGGNQSTGILAGLEVHPGIPFDRGDGQYVNDNLFEVFETEWLEVDEKTGYLTRYEGVRIGSDIFIERGESKYIIRSQDNPSHCTLSINGMFFLDINGSPMSLMIQTMNIQDKYDLLIFYRDSLIANSGTVGDWVDLAIIPEALGVEFSDRLQKWIAYKKSGMALFDSSQEGGNVVNTTFNGYDDTVKAQSIQAISIAIQSLEMQVSGITGVLPERLAQYEQRDAVSNVKLGVTMSGILTKQYFETMDILYKEANYDLLNLSKLVYKDGITSSIILGDGYSKIFTALPDHYTITDFDIHIEDSTANYKDRETIKALSMELVKGGGADIETVVNVISAKNMTELKRYVDRSIKVKKEENNIISQLQQQVSQYEQQMKQAEQQMNNMMEENKTLNTQLQANNAEKLKIDYKKLELEKEKIENQYKIDEKSNEIKERHLEVEIGQQTDGNPYNDIIK